MYERVCRGKGTWANTIFFIHIVGRIFDETWLYNYCYRRTLPCSFLKLIKPIGEEGLGTDFAEPQPRDELL